MYEKKKRTNNVFLIELIATVIATILGIVLDNYVYTFFAKIGFCVVLYALWLKYFGLYLFTLRKTLKVFNIKNNEEKKIIFKFNNDSLELIHNTESIRLYKFSDIQTWNEDKEYIFILFENYEFIIIEKNMLQLEEDLLKDYLNITKKSKNMKDNYYKKLKIILVIVIVISLTISTFIVLIIRKKYPVDTKIYSISNYCSDIKCSYITTPKRVAEFNLNLSEPDLNKEIILTFSKNSENAYITKNGTLIIEMTDKQKERVLKKLKDIIYYYKEKIEEKCKVEINEDCTELKIYDSQVRLREKEIIQYMIWYVKIEKNISDSFPINIIFINDTTSKEMFRIEQFGTYREIVY